MIVHSSCLEHVPVRVLEAVLYGSPVDGTRHDDDVCVFSRCFPGVLLSNLYLRTVYNHMDAIIMCWD